MMNESMRKLIKLNACPVGVLYLKGKDPRDAWNNCERGDWMLWLAYRSGVDIKKITLVKVKCARLVEHLMKDHRSVNALDVAEKFAIGEASKEELDAAAGGAYHAAADAARTTARTATSYASYASYAAAADDAAYASYAAATATHVVDTTSAAVVYTVDASSTTRRDILLKCADICREVISFEDLNF